MFVFIANEKEDLGIIGSSVKLKCLYSGKDPFKINKFRVQWQTREEENCLVDAFFPNQDTRRHQCKNFTNRTLFDEQLKKGDFSLWLFNVSHSDERTYYCVVQRNESAMYKPVLRENITLKVAGKDLSFKAQFHNQ